jgi:site-specific DNA-methyltransferase (adenine-specific)
MPAFQTLQRLGPAQPPTPLYPDGRNRLIWGDCLAVMAALPDASLDVIYVDPPFCTGQQRRLHKDDGDARPSYADSWEDLPAFLAFVEARLTRARELLTPTGALFVHLDWHAVHYVKVLLDRLFGAAHFQNEFIWYYSGGGTARTRFARKHDTILYYTRSATRWVFHADRVRTPHRWDRGQRRADGSARDYTRGKLPDDVWEHHSVMPWGEENWGYPTQKPLALLERLLLATTDPGMTVGDFFAGSGTTGVVAGRLGCRWVLTDRSRVAVCVAAERLAHEVSPGCVAAQGARAGARARTRQAAILADPARVGVPAEVLALPGQESLSAIGFTVERCGAGVVGDEDGEIPSDEFPREVGV